MPASRHPGWFWLPFALAVGLALRLANLASLRRSPLFDRPVLDGQFCVDWATQILAGTAPAAPFFQDPLYPHLLAAIFRVFGRGYWPVYIFQLLLGLLVVVLVHDTTRRVFGRRAAAAAAAFAAVYRPFVYYEGQIEKTSVAVAMTALFLWTLVRALRSRSPGRSAQAGIALGLTCLARGNLLVFVPLLPAALLAGRSGAWRSNRTSAVAALAGALPLPGFMFVFAIGAPWLVLRGGRRGARSALAGFSALYALAVVSFFVFSRYRVPAVPALLPFAGGFAAFLTRSALRGATPRGPFRRSLALCLGALALSLAPVDRIPAARSAAQSLASIGAQQYREGDLPGAERSFRAALAEDPTLVGALRSLGVLHVRRGETGDAAPVLERAVAIDPGDAVSRHYLGLVHESRGAWAAALREFEAALSLAPWRTDFLAARDRARARLQRPPGGTAPP